MIIKTKDQAKHLILEDLILEDLIPHQPLLLLLLLLLLLIMVLTVAAVAEIAAETTEEAAVLRDLQVQVDQMQWGHLKKEA